MTFTPTQESGKSVAERMGERDSMRAESLMEREGLEAVSFTFPLNEWEEVPKVLEFVQNSVGNVTGNEVAMLPSGKQGLTVFCKVPAKNVGAVYAQHVMNLFNVSVERWRHRPWQVERAERVQRGLRTSSTCCRSERGRGTCRRPLGPHRTR